MKIKKAAQQSGLTPRNIRFYEESGLIGVGREENGYREYNEDDVIRLKQIRVLRELGISIEDIRKFFKKQISLNELMKQRIDELSKQKDDVQILLEICNNIEKQDLPLTEYTTGNIDLALGSRNVENKRRYGKLLTSEWGNYNTRKAILKNMIPSLIYAGWWVGMLIFFTFSLLSLNKIVEFNTWQAQLILVSTILIGTLTVGMMLVKNNHYELHEDGIYFINTNTTISSISYFYHVLKNDYLKYMEFIDYEEISVVKTGVQEAGMITGGDYLFKFYLVVFTKNDRAVRLDSDLFFNGKHFLTTLRILHDKAPKWVDPKHLAKLLEMPKDKAYNILNTYYWNKRPWHNTDLYRRLSKNK